MAHDPHAQIADRLIRSANYKIATTSRGRFTISCVKALLDTIQEDTATATKIWELAVRLHTGEFIREKLLCGLFFLERHQITKATGISLFDSNNTDSLFRAGFESIANAINKASSYYAKGGPKVWAVGIADCLNTRRRVNLIPAPELKKSSKAA